MAKCIHCGNVRQEGRLCICRLEAPQVVAGEKATDVTKYQLLQLLSDAYSLIPDGTESNLLPSIKNAVYNAKYGQASTIQHISNYATEIGERLVRTLQAELPNEYWDRIQQIVDGNFENIHNKINTPMQETGKFNLFETSGGTIQSANSDKLIAETGKSLEDEIGLEDARDEFAIKIGLKDYNEVIKRANELQGQAIVDLIKVTHNAAELYALKSQPEWISVEDRLPDNNSRVIGLQTENEGFISDYNILDLFYTNKMFFSGNENTINSLETDIKFWMLPQPPKDR